MKLVNTKKKCKPKNNDNLESSSHLFTWTQLTSYWGPPIRSQHAVCKSGDYVYLYGGQSQCKTLRDFWKFNIKAPCWSAIKSTKTTVQPPALKGHTIVDYNDDLYMFGGFTYAREVPLWKFDTQMKEWTKLITTKATVKSRSEHVCVVHNEKMYVHGGYVDFKGPTNEMWMYDLKRNVWDLIKAATKGTCPCPRYKHSGVVFRDTLWLSGGLMNVGARNKFQVWTWNFSTSLWNSISTSGTPSALYNHLSCVAGNDMYVFGGNRGHGKNNIKLWKVSLAKSYYKSSQNWKMCLFRNKNVPPLPGSSCMVSVVETESNWKKRVHQDDKTSKSISIVGDRKTEKLLSANEPLQQENVTRKTILPCDKESYNCKDKVVGFELGNDVMSKNACFVSPTDNVLQHCTSMTLKLPKGRPKSNKNNQLCSSVEETVNIDIMNPSDDCDQEDCLVNTDESMLLISDAQSSDAISDLTKSQSQNENIVGSSNQLSGEGADCKNGTAPELSSINDSCLIECDDSVSLLPTEKDYASEKVLEVNGENHFIANDSESEVLCGTDLDALLIPNSASHHIQKQKYESKVLQQAGVGASHMYLTRKFPQKLKQLVSSISSIYEPELYKALDNSIANIHDSNPSTKRQLSQSAICVAQSDSGEDRFSKNDDTQGEFSSHQDQTIKMMQEPFQTNSVILRKMDKEITNNSVTELSNVSTKLSLLFFGGKEVRKNFQKKGYTLVWKYNFSDN